MSNRDSMGFKVVGSLGGGGVPPSRAYYKAAGTTVTHDLFIGDAVKPSGSADANGRQGVVLATAGDTPVGWITGFKINPADPLERATWIDGASEGYPLVCDDPNAIAEIQADDVIAATDIGLNADLVQTAAGSRTSGMSGQEIDQSTKATTSTLVYRIYGMPPRADNTINAENNKVLVVHNVHAYKSVGVDGV